MVRKPPHTKPALKATACTDHTRGGLGHGGNVGRGIEGRKRGAVCQNTQVCGKPVDQDRLSIDTLLGTGAGGFARDVCLDTMFRVLFRKLLFGVTSVREGRIVIYRPQP